MIREKGRRAFPVVGRYQKAPPIQKIWAGGAFYFLFKTPNSLLCSRRLKSRNRCRNIHLGHMIPPPQVLKVNSLRVFSLGFVIAGRSFLPVGMEKGSRFSRLPLQYEDKIIQFAAGSCSDTSSPEVWLLGSGSYPSGFPSKSVL